MTVLVGGVGELFQGDLDFGRLVAETLAGEALGPGVLVEELTYGALAVAHRLEEVAPSALVLVGAVARGRPLGSVERRRVRDLRPNVEDVQQSVYDAATGYVTIDLLTEVCAGFGRLPSRTVTIELEPSVAGGPIAQLSADAQAAMPVALDLVRAEVRRIPLFELADQLRPRCDDDRLGPALATGAMRDLLAGLAVLDDEGRWAATFAARDRLRQLIAEGRTADEMDHVDWAMWWALIEEIDRLQPIESTV